MVARKKRWETPQLRKIGDRIPPVRERWPRACKVLATYIAKGDEPTERELDRAAAFIRRYVVLRDHGRYALDADAHGYVLAKVLGRRHEG